MIGIHRILVATDLSPLSECAVQDGCQLAKQFGAELHLLTVVSYPFSEFAQQCQQDYGKSIEDCEAEHYAHAEEQLRAIDVAPVDKARVTRVARKGFPIAEIQRYATTQKADLLILGTHGLTGFKHVFVGSVAEAIVRTAHCPVLTVRDHTHQYESARVPS